MGILEELKNMSMPTVQADGQSVDEQSEEEKKRIKEKIRLEQKKILAVLDSDSPGLDEPYPYMEVRERELVTGRKVEVKKVPSPWGTFEERKVLDDGEITGSQKSLFISNKVVTKREMLIRRLLEIDSWDLQKSGSETVIGKTGEGEISPNNNKRVLGIDEVKEYMEYVPENVKKEIELKRQKIELIKNTKTREMGKKGVLVRTTHSGTYIPSTDCAAVETTFGKTLLALGEEGVKKHFHGRREIEELFDSEEQYKKFMENNNMAGTISLDTIASAIEKYLRGVR